MNLGLFRRSVPDGEVCAEDTGFTSHFVRGVRVLLPLGVSSGAKSRYLEMLDEYNMWDVDPEKAEEVVYQLQWDGDGFKVRRDGRLRGSAGLAMQTYAEWRIAG